MLKSEIFAETLGIVSILSEIPCKKILSHSKEADVVDARSILVYILHRKGFYSCEIASYIHKTRRSVNQLISGFDGRLKQGKMFRIILEKVRKQTGID